MFCRLIFVIQIYLKLRLGFVLLKIKIKSNAKWHIKSHLNVWQFDHFVLILVFKYKVAQNES